MIPHFSIRKHGPEIIISYQDCEILAMWHHPYLYALHRWIHGYSSHVPFELESLDDHNIDYACIIDGVDIV